MAAPLPHPSKSHGYRLPSSAVLRLFFFSGCPFEPSVERSAGVDALG